MIVAEPQIQSPGAFGRARSDGPKLLERWVRAPSWMTEVRTLELHPGLEAMHRLKARAQIP